MVSEYHRIKSPLKLVYYRGNIMASYSYEGRTFRYPLFKVEEHLFSKKMIALKESPLYDCDTVVHDIEKKVEAIDAALKEIEKKREPGETITKSVVDAFMQFSNEQAKKKVAVSKGLIDDLPFGWRISKSRSTMRKSARGSSRERYTPRPRTTPPR